MKITLKLDHKYVEFESNKLNIILDSGKSFSLEEGGLEEDSITINKSTLSSNGRINIIPHVSNEIELK